jgi:hypothetical protein
MSAKIDFTPKGINGKASWPPPHNISQFLEQFERRQREEVEVHLFACTVAINVLERALVGVVSDFEPFTGEDIYLALDNLKAYLTRLVRHEQ